MSERKSLVPQRKLDSSAHYNSEHYDRTHPSPPDWQPKKSFSKQWKEMGKEGLTEEQWQEGVQLTKKLDALREEHIDFMRGKLIEEMRKR